MNKHCLSATGMRVAGYGALTERFRLDVLPNWHRSLVATGNTHRVDTRRGMGPASIIGDVQPWQEIQEEVVRPKRELTRVPQEWTDLLCRGGDIDGRDPLLQQ